MNIDRLEDIWLFSSLSKDELGKVSRWVDELEVPEGKVLAEEGSIAHEFFVIEDGAASVTQNGTEIATLGPGDFFGEIGLLETVRRTASVVATTPMRVRVMFQREFKQMEREMPAVAERIRAAIYARLH
jgi:CRP/FNR family transcriptional regulator, cyclic AMP receptor protein